MKAKKCPVCDSSELQYVYYAPSAKDEPAMWEDTVDCGYSPMILFKRIECKKCGASVPSLTMTLDDALSYWNDINDKTNHRYVMQCIGTEDVLEIEEDEE